MKHARADYDPIQDPRGIIPDDEPVFLLRGQDIFAADLVALWAEKMNNAIGGGEIVEMAKRQATAMRAWPKHKLPDLAVPENYGDEYADGSVQAAAMGAEPDAPELEPDFEGDVNDEDSDDLEPDGPTPAEEADDRAESLAMSAAEDAQGRRDQEDTEPSPEPEPDAEPSLEDVLAADPKESPDGGKTD